MNKIMTWLIAGFFLVSLATAGIIGISSWEKDITLDKTTIDKIKDVSDVKTIDVEIGKIQCDSKECWATLYQKDLIQTEWRRNRNYCSKFNTTTIEKENIETECIGYTDYTLEENKQAIQEYLEKRLSSWATVEKERQEEVIEDKTEVGIIKERSLEIIK